MIHLKKYILDNGCNCCPLVQDCHINKGTDACHMVLDRMLIEHEPTRIAVRQRDVAIDWLVELVSCDKCPVRDECSCLIFVCRDKLTEYITGRII